MSRALRLKDVAPPTANVSAIEAAHARASSGELRTIPVAQLAPSPWQPRAAVLDDDAFEALVESVRQHGVLEPVLVRELPSGYELLAGERRWRAACAAGLHEVPARVLVTVDDVHAREIALTENLARTDLGAYEIARAMAALAEAYRTAGKPASIRALAAATGYSKSAVDRALRIAEVCTEALWRETFGTALPPQWDLVAGQVLEALARATSHDERTKRLRAWHAARAEVTSAPVAAGDDRTLRRGPRAAKPAVEVTGAVAAGRFALTLRTPIDRLTLEDVDSLVDALAPLLRAVQARRTALTADSPPVPR